MSISVEDIEILLFDEDIKEFLECVSEGDIDKKVIINIILVVFINRDFESPDWLKEIIFKIEKEKFNSDMLAPKLKDVSGIETVFNELVVKLYDLNNNGKLLYNDYCVTYDMFNEYLDVLYDWFKENFETV